MCLAERLKREVQCIIIRGLDDEVTWITFETDPTSIICNAGRPSGQRRNCLRERALTARPWPSTSAAALDDDAVHAADEGAAHAEGQGQRVA